MKIEFLYEIDISNTNHDHLPYISCSARYQSEMTSRELCCCFVFVSVESKGGELKFGKSLSK